MRILTLFCCLLLGLLTGRPGQSDETRSIVLIAGELDQAHPRGTHEYQRTIELFRDSLEPLQQHLDCEITSCLGGWPIDESVLDSADTIVLVSSGGDRNLSDHPFFVGDRLRVIERQMDRGCGLVLIHWSVFWPTEFQQQAFDWVGGFFDYESGSTANRWFSRIGTHTSQCRFASTQHEIANGLEPFSVREEFYYNIRFPDEPDRRPTPLLEARIPGEGQQTVAWALERPDGGRGFALTGGHFFENWAIDDYRRLVLHAILWTAHVPVPGKGVQLAGNQRFDEKQVLLLTGHQHPAHDWRKTTDVLVDLLAQDHRLPVRVETDLEFLADRELHNYDTIVFNYCNWQDRGLSETAKENLMAFVNRGGGIVFIHFSNGAFHHSLPGAEDSDWPEFRNLCRRVWDHSPGTSGHEPFGRFDVVVSDLQHPITARIENFETIDELYFRQQGELPVEILATAFSPTTGQDEPMVTVHQYGKGRVFQTVLGHAAESLRVPQVATVVRRGVAWTAGIDAGKLDLPALAEQDETDEEYLKKWTPKLRQNTRFPYETESDPDWVDDRFQKMDTGPFFCSSIHVPGQPIVPKAIAVKVSEDPPAAMLYDMRKMQLVGAWTGSFLEIPPDRFGILNFPKIAGESIIVSDRDQAWRLTAAGDKSDTAMPRLVALHVATHSGQTHVTFEYEMGTARIFESPAYRQLDDGKVFVQRFRIENSPGLEMPVARSTGQTEKHPVWVVDDKEIVRTKDDTIEIAQRKSTQVFTVVHGAISNQDQLAFEETFARSDPILLTEETWSPGDRRFEDLPSVQGIRASVDSAYVVDTIPLPFENPFDALLFCSGVDFDSKGFAYVCTIHGDVWQVEGVDEHLDNVVWRRFATGLYQPLGLKIVDDQIYVLGRDRITRLHDENHDGEADCYESFNDDLVVTGQPHGYAMGLETDPQGNFYFIKSGGSAPHGGTMLRISADGKSMDVFATGYRHANGMGIGPDGFITSADNEGNWMPSTRIDHVRRGGFYGHMPTHRRSVEPETFDPPLCWLPRSLDNSAGGQVWAPANWGPLSGQMLHLSYGRCTINPVLRQKIDDQWQAATYKLPVDTFQSGIHRGRFNPRDGHLYVVGTDGWQTAAVADGCLQRVRYTGKESALPIGFTVYRDRIEIDFSAPLDLKIAAEKKNYFVQHWNYRWASEYGSEHYSVNEPEKIGQDIVEVSRVAVTPDGKRVSIFIDDLKPVMQMQIQANLISAVGLPVAVDLYNTIHSFADE